MKAKWTLASSENLIPLDSPLFGMEDVLMRYVFGRKKTTEFGYLVWKRVVLKGDTVIGDSCGYGYDTLAMVNMLADELARTVFMQCIFRIMP
nr:hypothetical protein CFP56_49209 [Quercus suber]